MERPKRARLHINVLIPTLLTLTALCSGLTAIRFGRSSLDMTVFGSSRMNDLYQYHMGRYYHQDR